MISVIIPSRLGEDSSLTMNSLRRQTEPVDEIHVIIDREARGCSWARNRGFERAAGDLVLFSDTDIEWAPDAIARLRAALDRSPSGPDDAGRRVGYAYGPYLETGVPGRWWQWRRGTNGPIGAQQWDHSALCEENYISPMCLVRREVFVPFDESLRRLQDWDLWLMLAARGVKGVWAGPDPVFTTPYRFGLTHGPGTVASYLAARATIEDRHGLRVKTPRCPCGRPRDPIRSFCELCREMAEAERQ